MISCKDCSHSRVCGLYDALWDTVVIICDYDQTDPELTDRLCETLAGNCKQFLREE
jgi:hypothetical protein